MPFRNHVSWTKGQRAWADNRPGMGNFAVGSRAGKAKTHSEISGQMSWRMCDALFAFACMLYSGKSPREAFDALTWPEAESKEVA